MMEEELLSDVAVHSVCHHLLVLSCRTCDQQPLVAAVCRHDAALFFVVALLY